MEARSRITFGLRKRRAPEGGSADEDADIISVS